MAKNKKQDENPVSRGIRFTREAWEELKKVQLPSRQETIQVTILVMAMVVVFAVFLGLSDLLVGRIMGGLLTKEVGFAWFM